MTEWQPIETAPKDGTTVILFFPGLIHEQQTGYFSRRESYSNGKLDYSSARWVWGSGYSSMMGDDPKPTHWMPFPPSPIGEIK